MPFTVLIDKVSLEAVQVQGSVFSNNGYDFDNATEQN